MKQLFISRQLQAQSPFYTQLLASEFEIYAESLISFSEVEIAAVPASDILFFYSKNAVRFAVKHPLLREAMQARQLAAMGEGTAAVLRSYDFNPVFIGVSKPENTAQKLHTFLRPEEEILFLRASNSKQSIQQFLPKGRKTESVIVYKNEPKTVFDIPPSDILIFTSPINAQAYFSKHKLSAPQKVIAIGFTTAQALHDLGISEVLVAKQPSEAALVDMVKNLDL